MNTKKLIVCFLAIFSLHSITKGQSESLTEGVKENLFSDWQAGIFLGMSSYEGDVHCFKEENINVFTEANFAFGLNAYRSINENIKVGVRYMNTKISGSDAAFTSGKGHKERGFSFQNKINEISIDIQYAPFGHKFWKISPYISGGIGLAFGKSDTNYRRTEQSQYITEFINQDIEAATSSSIAFPLGVGLSITASNRMSINLEAALRFGLNDFMDGVSNSGNPIVNDYYGAGGINITYSFGKIKQKFTNTIKEF